MIAKPEMSAREAEVLAAVGAHLSNAQIASRLHLSVRTVEGHVSALLRKHGVKDRRELAELAVSLAAQPQTPRGVIGLPTARTTFIGREAELETIASRLAEGRLVSLVGPGGVGKSRLATAIADACSPYGGAWVDLVPVSGDLVPQAVAAVLGVAEGPQQPLLDAVFTRLRASRFLLILDNCEHVIEAVADLLERLLAACPRVTVLATSRERLFLPGEEVIQIDPLPLGSDAERLYLDRAATAGEDLAPELVTDLCARLDGLPLAIELAAARCGALGTAGLLTGLGDYLRILAGGRGQAVRHRSLRSVIDWSHDLLDEEERRFLAELSVFSGGFDIASAASITATEPTAAADLIGRLVDKSLVQHDTVAGRWRLLSTIRAYAVEQLSATGRVEEIRQRHFAWAVDVAVEVPDAFDRFADDLRSALANCPPGTDVTAHRLARALGQLTFARRFLHEAEGHFAEAARRAPSPREAAEDLRNAAGCAFVLTFSVDRPFPLLVEAFETAAAGGERELAAVLAAEAINICSRFIGGILAEPTPEEFDRLLAATDGISGAATDLAHAWHPTAVRFVPDVRRSQVAVATARADGDPVAMSAALDALHIALAAQGRAREGHLVTMQRRDLMSNLDRDRPRDAIELVDTLFSGSGSALTVGDLPAALEMAQRCAKDELTSRHPLLANCRVIPILALCGDLDEALGRADELWHAWLDGGGGRFAWLVAPVSAAALAAAMSGDEAGRSLWWERIDAVVTPEALYRYIAFATFVEARLAVHGGQTSGAAEIVARAFTPVPASPYNTYKRAAGAELAALAGLPNSAELLAEVATDAEQNDWAAACLARTRARQDGDRKRLTAAAEQFKRIGARLEYECTMRLLP